MTENLSQLKQIIPVLAAAAGISVFVLVRILADLLLDHLLLRKAGKASWTDDEFRTEKEKIIRYEKIIRKENVNYTWMIKAAGFLSTALLASAALFHRMILAKTGPELFCAVILILSASAAFFILQDKRWKTSAADDLILYAFLFEAAARDEHTGIRMMLLDSDTDFPLKPLLLEIRKDNPGISGNELMRTAGKILKSGALIRAYSGKPKDPAAEKGRENRFGRMDVYSTVFVFLAFGIMIVLCFLL